MALSFSSVPVDYRKTEFSYECREPGGKLLGWYIAPHTLGGEYVIIRAPKSKLPPDFLERNERDVYTTADVRVGAANPSVGAIGTVEEVFVCGYLSWQVYLCMDALPTAARSFGLEVRDWWQKELLMACGLFYPVDPLIINPKSSHEAWLKVLAAVQGTGFHKNDGESNLEAVLRFIDERSKPSKAREYLDELRQQFNEAWMRLDYRTAERIAKLIGHPSPIEHELKDIKP